MRTVVAGTLVGLCVILTKSNVLYSLFVQGNVAAFQHCVDELKGDDVPRTQIGPVAELCRFSNLVFCRKGETTWHHRYAHQNSALRRFA